MPLTNQRVEFAGQSGATLAARLDLPGGPIRAYALFAHCFTCSKDLLGARCIASELARVGIAVMRFDFTGLGSSEGEFASTNFSSNVGDLLSAAEYLREHYEAPAVLMGHSLGGAAVLAVAGAVPEARAVVTVGAPASASHVLRHFGASLAAIERDGAAEVELAGRKLRIEKQFVEDVRTPNITRAVATMKKPLLVLHSPVDATVGIENATEIFRAAKHPKSFVSLDTADHLLTDPADATYTAQVIAGWVTRYVPASREEAEAPAVPVHVVETGAGRFQNAVRTGACRLLADEPNSVGGLGSGPSPYDFLSIALGACTSMTLRMYALHKKLTLGRIAVEVSHAKVYSKDCAECMAEVRSGDNRIDRFERVISIEGEVPVELRAKLAEIADKCPVHRTLDTGAKVVTKFERNGKGQPNGE